MTMRAALGVGRAGHRRPALSCAVWLACSQIAMSDPWRCIACLKAAESRKLARSRPADTHFSWPATATEHAGSQRR